ncbi:hypothetical protein KKA03_03535 [archaeon]|nr:hypothetical protein [archaeon]
MKRDKMTIAIAIFLVAVIMAGSTSSVFAGTKPECNDKIDNDGDGAVDMADAGCDKRGDNDESNCGDGVCEGGEDTGSCPADCGPADSCSDTDGGYNIMVLGTTSGYLNQVPYSNDDYCIDADNTNEYYCMGDYEASQQQSCGPDENYLPYCVGDSVYHDYIDRFCASGACSNTTTPALIETCEFGCSAGACLPQPDSCSDTDGGWNTELFGTISGYQNGTQYGFDEVCLDSTMLLEYYCNGGSAESYVWDCVNMTTSCVNGACV